MEGNGTVVLLRRGKEWTLRGRTETASSIVGAVPWNAYQSKEIVLFCMFYVSSSLIQSLMGYENTIKIRTNSLKISSYVF